MGQTSVKRRLAAILAADVANYTRMMNSDEDTTMQFWWSYRSEIIDPKIAEHQGRIVKLTGDGFLAEFSTVQDAVKCASEIQSAIDTRNADVPEHKRMVFRMGINLGDIIVDDEDIYGDGVNIAARLESLAEPGGIFVSADVFNQVRNKLDLRFEALGERTVKNIPDPITVYRVRLGESPAEAWPNATKPHPSRWRWSVGVTTILLLLAGGGAWWLTPDESESDRGRFRLPDRPSIAVLSFDTFGNEESQRFLAEGIAEDIITELSRNSELTVMARSSTFALRDKGLSATEIAEHLDVHYALEGSVRRFGNKLRISAQLIEAATGNHVWAEQYNVTASDIYEMQDEIVTKIVGTLFSEIRETEKAAILRRPPSSLDVYELTLNGLARKHRLNAEDSRIAREELLRAVALDPDYAPAWLYLGWVEVIAIMFEWIDELDYSDLHDATIKIERAIELNPQLATAYQALSLARTVAGDLEGALQASKRSVELGPGDADNLLFLARALASNGEFDAAVVHARHAMALNPSRPSYYVYHLGRALWGQHAFDDTIRLSKECLTKAPGFTACRVFQIASHVAMQEVSEASKAADALLEQSPNFTVEDALKGVGFGGDENANNRLKAQLLQAGLPTDESASVKR